MLDDDAAQKNMAYLAKTASENILSLQRIVHEQEVQLEDRRKEAATLQRNYEALSRIRLSDNKELASLREQRQQEGESMRHLRDELAAEKGESDRLREKLRESEEALAEVAALKLEVQAAERKHAQAVTHAEGVQAQVADLQEANKALRSSAERLSRGHTNISEKLRREGEARAQLEREHAALRKEAAAAGAKLTHMEKQLRTFLDFNATMEADLRGAMARAAELEKQVRQLEHDRQTAEAYHSARHAEMQAQLQTALGTSAGGGAAAAPAEGRAPAP